jgi:hypothetical protein
MELVKVVANITYHVKRLKWQQYYTIIVAGGSYRLTPPDFSIVFFPS